MRLTALFCALALASAAHGADGAYKLDLGASKEGGSLKVEPTLTGPAGKTVNYEMRVRREGDGKSSNSSQGGTVRLDDSGQARLASNSVNVAPNDRYTVTVRVLEGSRVVAEKTEQHP